MEKFISKKKENIMKMVVGNTNDFIIFCKRLFIFVVFFYADETDVSVVSLDEQLEDWTDKEISDFVSFDLYYTCL